MFTHAENQIGDTFTSEQGKQNRKVKLFLEYTLASGIIACDASSHSANVFRGTVAQW